MSLAIYVDSYSAYKANERPRQFVLDEDIFEIEAVEQQWRTPDAAFFKVRTNSGKHYLLRHNETEDQWALQSDFDGAELLSRSGIDLVTVQPAAIRDAESRIVGCERCCPGNSELLFDSILADVLDKHGVFEFVMAEPAKCPNCRGAISEKTLKMLVIPSAASRRMATFLTSCTRARRVPLRRYQASSRRMR
jgi:hypothetical protein